MLQPSWTSSVSWTSYVLKKWNWDATKPWIYFSDCGVSIWKMFLAARVWELIRQTTWTTTTLTTREPRRRTEGRSLVCRRMWRPAWTTGTGGRTRKIANCLPKSFLPPPPLNFTLTLSILTITYPRVITLSPIRKKPVSALLFGGVGGNSANPRGCWLYLPRFCTSPGEFT